MLLGLPVGAVMASLLMRLRRGTPYALLALGTALMNVAIGIAIPAIPAMTASVMRVAGKQHANSAAAALIGSILHMLQDWSLRLPLAYATITAAYGLVACLVYKHVHFPKAAAAA
ncbi:hypothetical protein [Janthinobacterium sp. ROICE36]|uniref:hypothetical protein n=1 Tax=Janthinobacterium sp. ROICE36 TaxID=2048670 RepID=UPI0015E06724|nr:hypothetical protein [Janthinobacterium sp. ROICE36]